MSSPSTSSIFSLLARQNEVIRRVKNGGLTIEEALAGTQAILDRRQLTPTERATEPGWYVSPEEQLVKLAALNERRGWGFSDFEKLSTIVPGPRPTDNSVQMLNITGAQNLRGMSFFNEIWDAIECPGLRKDRSRNTSKEGQGLRQMQRLIQSPSIHWVWFDPTTYTGLSPDAALASAIDEKLFLAGTEVLVAAMLFPEWVRSWGGWKSPRPMMSGLLLSMNSEDPEVPILRGDNEAGVLLLETTKAARGNPYWASPIVEKC